MITIFGIEKTSEMPRSYRTPLALSRRLNFSEIHMPSIGQTTDPLHRLGFISGRHDNKGPLEAAVVTLPGGSRERKFRHAGKLPFELRNTVDEVQVYVMPVAKTLKALFI